MIFVFLISISATAASSGAPWWQRFELAAPKVDPDRIRASSLMKRRKLADCEQAVELLERSLAKTPHDDALALECAVALNACMRIKTHSNTLHITRMLDTPEHKKVWRKLGPRALELASRAKQARPNDPDALVAYADAYFFANSVKGEIGRAHV